MIKVLKQHIFLLCDADNLFPEQLFVEKLAHLESDLCIFVRIERSDSGFCGTERFSPESLFLISVKIFMI